MDAEAISDAASRPTMRFVPVKTPEQQDLQALHRIRERLVCQRTALINQMRGLLGEYGIAPAARPLGRRGRADGTRLGEEILQASARQGLATS
ncbi:transposase [Constrictibacter sp. MBR-5]